MKVDGQIFKIKLPAKAMDVLKDYSDQHVLLDSESVKKFGIRAPRIRPGTELKHKNIYFLVDLPKFPEERQPRMRRVKSEGTAKARLDSLMMKQRSISEFGSSAQGPVRVKMRLPKVEIERLMKESSDEAEVGDKILDFCLQNCTYELDHIDK